jgi:hypothetical protein
MVVIFDSTVTETYFTLPSKAAYVIGLNAMVNGNVAEIPLSKVVFIDVKLIKKYSIEIIVNNFPIRITCN